MRCVTEALVANARDLSDLREKFGLPSTDGVRPVSRKPA